MLTAAEVKAKASKPVLRPTKISDEKGLFLLLNPKRRPGWRFKYRYGGREKQLSLGTYPEISLSEARRQRDRLRLQITEGADPSEARKQAKLERAADNDLQLSKVGGRWFEKWAIGKAPKTTYNVKMRLGYLPCNLVRSSVNKITSSDIARALTQIESERGAIVASKVMVITRQIFRYAKAHGLIQTNPAVDLSDVLSRPVRGHLAAETNPERLGEVLDKLDRYTGTPPVHAALNLMPRLFCRPADMRLMRWDDLYDIDGSKPEWRYLISKTKTEQIVPLPTQAVSIIKMLNPLTGCCPYVFEGRSRGKPISLAVFNTAMRTLGLQGQQTSHGFRATARTLLDEVLGFRVDLIEHQLGHQVRDPLGRAYNRTSHIEDRRQMMQQWADYLDELRSRTKN